MDTAEVITEMETPVVTGALLPNENLKHMVTELKEARSTLGATITELDVITAEWKKNPAYVRLMKLKETIATEIDSLVKGIKELAVAEYKLTANKKPVEGVEIKLFDEYAIDTAAALTWAEKEFPAAIKKTVDEAMLLAVVKKLPADKLPTWVTRNETPKAQIATKL